MENQDFKTVLIGNIQGVVKQLFGLDNEVVLEKPVNASFGDITTNIALTTANKIGKNPREVASLIVDVLKEKTAENEYIKDIQIAGPGFINITISSKYYLENLLLIDDNYGNWLSRDKKRMMIEMGDPNTHKLPHIGHLFSYIVGDSLSRIRAAGGDEIFRATYQSDIGLPVAKCLYAWIKRGRPTADSLQGKVSILQDCYLEGSNSYNDSEEAKEGIQQINKALYEGDDTYLDDWKQTREWSVSYYEQFEKELGIQINKHYWESMVWRYGLGVVEESLRAGKVFEESEGAVIFPGEKHGLHNRVFITRRHTPTYEAKELGLAKIKMEDWPYDMTVIPTASEQNEYFRVVIEAIDELFPELKGKIKHIGHGMISLTTGKMGSRKGNVLSGDALVAMVLDKVREIMSTRVDLSQDEKETISKKVALGAIKYTFLKTNALTDIVFDVEKSVSFEGNSGPYLQYTYARIQTLIAKGDTLQDLHVNDLASLLIEPEETALAKKLEEFPQVVKDTYETYSPHRIGNYLFELSQAFNFFYTKHSINAANTKQLQDARRLLSDKTAHVIKNGLYLLGIEVVEKM